MRYFSWNFHPDFEDYFMLFILYIECDLQMNESILGKVTHDTLSFE